MEMRLGKSAVPLRWILRHVERPRVLVVAPATTLPGWHREAEAEGFAAWQLAKPVGGFVRGDAPRSPTEAVYAAFSREDGAGEVPQPDRPTVYTVNPELIHRRRGFFNHAADWFDLVVLDEASRARNPRAAFTKYLLKHIARVPRRIALTGTPQPESSLDWFGPLKFIAGADGLVMGRFNFWDWRERWFSPDEWGGKWEPVRGFKKALMEDLERVSYVLTRQAAGLNTPKVYERRSCLLPENARALYDRAIKKFIVNGEEVIYRPQVASYLRRMAGGVAEDCPGNWKLDLLVETVKGLKGKSLVVWSWHRQEVQAVYNALRWIGPAAMITGDHKPAVREDHRRRFQAGQFQYLSVQVANRPLRS